MPHQMALLLFQHPLQCLLMPVWFIATRSFSLQADLAMFRRKNPSSPENPHIPPIPAAHADGELSPLQTEEAAARGAAAGAAGAAAPFSARQWGDWVEYLTEDNHPYYYNATTNETTWEPPSGFWDAGANSTSPAGPAAAVVATPVAPVSPAAARSPYPVAALTDTSSAPSYSGFRITLDRAKSREPASSNASASGGVPMLGLGLGLGLKASTHSFSGPPSPAGSAPGTPKTPAGTDGSTMELTGRSSASHDPLHHDSAGIGAAAAGYMSPREGGSWFQRMKARVLKWVDTPPNEPDQNVVPLEDLTANGSAANAGAARNSWSQANLLTAPNERSSSNVDHLRGSSDADKDGATATTSLKDEGKSKEELLLEKDQAFERMPYRYVFLSRLAIVTVAVILLWSTSLNIATGIATLFLQSPSAREVVRSWGVAAQVTTFERRAHITCGQTQITQCATRLNATVDRLAAESLATSKANENTAGDANSKAATCQSAQVSMYAATQKWVKVDSVGHVILWLPGCSNDERVKVQQLIGDIGEVSSNAYALNAGYTREVSAVASQTIQSINNRTVYDVNYVQDKLSFLNVLAFSLKVPSDIFKAAILAAYDGIKSLVNMLVTCLARADGNCIWGPSLVEQYRILERQFVQAYNDLRNVITDGLTRFEN